MMGTRVCESSEQERSLHTAPKCCFQGQGLSKANLFCVCAGVGGGEPLFYVKGRWGQSQKAKNYDSIYIKYLVKFMDTEGGTVVARGWGVVRIRGSCSMGREFQFCKMKKSSGEWLHDNVNILNTIELYT